MEGAAHRSPMHHGHVRRHSSPKQHLAANIPHLETLTTQTVTILTASLLLARVVVRLWSRLFALLRRLLHEVMLLTLRVHHRHSIGVMHEGLRVHERRSSILKLVLFLPVAILLMADKVTLSLGLESIDVRATVRLLRFLVRVLPHHDFTDAVSVQIVHVKVWTVRTLVIFFVHFY